MKFLKNVETKYLSHPRLLSIISGFQVFPGLLQCCLATRILDKLHLSYLVPNVLNSLLLWSVYLIYTHDKTGFGNTSRKYIKNIVQLGKMQREKMHHGRVQNKSKQHKKNHSMKKLVQPEKTAMSSECSMEDCHRRVHFE